MPLTVMLPALRGTNPKTAFSKEVFPRPDCPEMQAISPSCSCKQKPEKSVSAPKAMHALSI